MLSPQSSVLMSPQSSVLSPQSSVLMLSPHTQSSVESSVLVYTARRMSELRLFNTLSREKETFIPLTPGEVRMYSCGPTVYSHLHIGNYRTFIWSDVLRRY